LRPLRGATRPGSPRAALGSGQRGSFRPPTASATACRALTCSSRPARRVGEKDSSASAVRHARPVPPRGKAACRTPCRRGPRHAAGPTRSAARSTPCWATRTEVLDQRGLGPAPPLHLARHHQRAHRQPLDPSRRAMRICAPARMSRCALAQRAQLLRPRHVTHCTGLATGQQAPQVRAHALEGTAQRARAHRRECTDSFSAVTLAPGEQPPAAWSPAASRVRAPRLLGHGCSQTTRLGCPSTLPPAVALGRGEGMAGSARRAVELCGSARPPPTPSISSKRSLFHEPGSWRQRRAGEWWAHSQRRVPPPAGSSPPASRGSRTLPAACALLGRSPIRPARSCRCGTRTSRLR